jgi:SNF2 family DNA or RNA helicase
MKQVIKIIEDDTSKYARNIIFSSWIKFGTKVLTKILTQKGITFAIISGETKSADRDRIVKEYNAGKINTLIITMAGSTGIDLKGVQNIIILDPVWNPATLEQIIGRGVRYKSHSDLPLDKRIVNVYRLMYVEKAFLDGKKAKSTSGDFILYTIIERKMKNKDASSEAVRRISIF